MKNKYITGILRHNDQGRYSFENGTYFTSGEPIELWNEVREEWMDGRIEYSHKHEDYYFVNEVEGIYIYYLYGCKARVKEE